MSTAMFCQTNSPKCEDIQFKIRENKENQQIFTWKKQEPLCFYHCCPKSLLKNFELTHFYTSDIFPFHAQIILND